jgi:uncharacterized Ntn-hydrolase superfamily protein
MAPMTYSIVARCPDSGMLGIAIATCLPAAGRVARFLEPGVGVVASQAQILPAHGSRILDALREGASPDEALGSSLALDPGAEHRQVGVVAADGRTAVHTGSLCIPHAGHATGDGYTAQANMMAAPGVPEAMAVAFEAGRGEPLAPRLLDALEAAEALGGDIRGRQSAAVHVQRAEATGDLLVDVVVDARVDDDPEPLVPLRRLVDLARAYDEGSRAGDLVLAGDLVAADEHYRTAMAHSAGDPQVPFWHAVALAGAGADDEAAVAWAELSTRGRVEPWVELLDRMVAAGLVEERVRRGLVGG